MDYFWTKNNLDISPAFCWPGARRWTKNLKAGKKAKNSTYLVVSSRGLDAPA
jgi:hypothetical protein